MARKYNILYKIFNTNLNSKDEVEIVRVSSLTKEIQSLKEDNKQG